jgi:hypothetical protein
MQLQKERRGRRRSSRQGQHSAVVSDGLVVSRADDYSIAPRRSRLTTWNAFLPMSMPIVATVKFDLLDMAVLLYLVAPSKHHSLEGAMQPIDESLFALGRLLNKLA